MKRKQRMKLRPTWTRRFGLVCTIEYGPFGEPLRQITGKYGKSFSDLPKEDMIQKYKEHYEYDENLRGNVRVIVEQ